MIRWGAGGEGGGGQIAPPPPPQEKLPSKSPALLRLIQRLREVLEFLQKMQLVIDASHFMMP